jgi:hypothetical protein
VTGYKLNIYKSILILFKYYLLNIKIKKIIYEYIILKLNALISAAWDFVIYKVTIKQIC